MLTIIRGLPGSGKSTLAVKLGGVHVEADQFMVDENGKYKFDPTRLKHCHEACKMAARRALLDGMDAVVSNTFTQLWEMQPYLDMAKELSVPVQILLCQGQFGSIHGVPIDKMQQMKERLEYEIPD